MSIEILMPQLGESVVEGTVSRWLIGEGQPVRQNQPLLQITTDKVDTELPAPASGILLKILVPEGDTVAKGTVLGVIGDQGSGSGDQGSGDHAASLSREHQAPATPVAQRMAAEHGLDLAEIAGAGPGGRITREDVEAYLAFSEGEYAPRAPTSQSTNLPITNLPASALGFISPAVARLAGELDVDLTQVIGTGEGGRITKKDVLAYVAAPVPREGGVILGGPLAAIDAVPAWEQPGAGFRPEPAVTFEVSAGAQPFGSSMPPASAEDDIVLLSSMRRSIAKHMLLSKQTAPHVTTVMEADMTSIVRAREGLRGEYERQGVRLTFTPFFVQAIVAGIQAVPEANSSFSDDALLRHRRIHIGMAVALPEGLIVPVICDADAKSLLGLARAVNDLTERARTKRMVPEEVQGGTFTLTNHGTGGSLFATPIIVQPQAGILGIGAIQKRAVVVSRGHPLLPDSEDAITIRPMVYLSFTFDHRVLDGAGADRFLAAVKQFLENYSG